MVAFILVRKFVVITEHYFTCKYEFVIDLAVSSVAIYEVAMDKD